MEPDVLDYLEDDQSVLEKAALERLADEGQLMSFIHKGFWQCMDSMREKALLENLVEQGKAPWMVWRGKND